MYKKYLSLIFFQLFLFCCSSNSNNPILTIGKYSYDLSSPSKIYILPKKLKEISGITLLTNDVVACIEDEDGTIFLYDLKNESITKEIKFAHKGDYEDIALAGDTFYVIESNGTLYENKDNESNKYPTNLNHYNNTEGLCYDSLNNELIISCKRKPKEILAFDLKEMKLKKKSFFEIKEKSFSPTAICLSPADNKNLLMLSNNNQLGIFDREGNVLKLINLDPLLFPQPEGMTFSKNGNLLISNEGHGREATILLFKNRNA